MNKPQPKYKTGDCVGSWLIVHGYYAPWLNEWVYNLELKSGKHKLTTTESILDTITA